MKTTFKVASVSGKFVEMRDGSVVAAVTWKNEWGDLPEIGEEFVIEREGGMSIVGIERVDGTVLKGREDFKKERDDWLDALHQKYEDDWENRGEEFMQRIMRLNTPFRVRIERFIREAGSAKDFFVKEMGEYELFIVEQAQELYDEYMTTYQPTSDYLDENKKMEHAQKWFDGFHSMSYEQQKRVFPKLDDGHSGNTFSGTVALARGVAINKSI